jgi:hypothetical protein
MAPRTSRSVASAAPDAQAHEPTDDNMSLDVPEQLLTPENSRSETSSSLFVSSSGSPGRNDARATRVDLRRPAGFSSASASSLRHSIAVMESSLWSGAPVDDDTVADDTAAPDSYPLIVSPGKTLRPVYRAPQCRRPRYHRRLELRSTRKIPSLQYCGGEKSEIVSLWQDFSPPQYCSDGIFLVERSSSRR